MKLKNKKFKGMTLVECVIALAILAISGTVMCTAGVGVLNLRRSANSMYEKINYQATVADNRYTSGKYVYTAGDGTQTNEDRVSAPQNSSMRLTVKGKSYIVNGETYTVVDRETNTINTDHNFRYFKVDINTTKDSSIVVAETTTSTT